MCWWAAINYECAEHLSLAIFTVIASTTDRERVSLFLSVYSSFWCSYRSVGNSLEAGFDKRLKFHISLLLVSSLCVISQPIEPRALVCPASRVAHLEWRSSAPRLISGLFQTLWMWNIGGVGQGAFPLGVLWAQDGKFPNERQECYCELSLELWCLKNGGLSVGFSFHQPLTLPLRSGEPLAEWIYMPLLKTGTTFFPLYNNLHVQQISHKVAVHILKGLFTWKW